MIVRCRRLPSSSRHHEPARPTAALVAHSPGPHHQVRYGRIILWDCNGVANQAIADPLAPPSPASRGSKGCPKVAYGQDIVRP